MKGPSGHSREKSSKLPGPAKKVCAKAKKPAKKAKNPPAAPSDPAWPSPKDGNTALIGAPHRGSTPGVAWVLNRSGSTWTMEEEPLRGSTETGQQNFGFSVALSSDGKHALVGAPLEHGGRGAAYVFEHIENGWTGAIPLTPTGEGAGGHLGFSLALSADGQDAIVGAPMDALHKGTAFVFEHITGTSWAQIGSPLTGKTESGEGHFGESVAMAGNGSTVLVGAPAENAKVGGVWTFVFVAGRWNEFGPRLGGPGGAKEEFGRGLAVSSDGSLAIVGAPKANARQQGVGAGSVTLYQALKAEWSLLQTLEAGPLENGNGQFGKSVSMTENAETVLVGAPHESFKVGAVWLFGKRPTVEELQLGEQSKGKAKGKLDGGNKLTVIGQNLKEAAAVWFGSNKALEIVERSGEADGKQKLVVIVPPGDEPGEVDVTVETADWLSAVKTSDQYLYVRTAGEEGQGGGGGGPSNKGGHGKGGSNEVPISSLNPPKTPTTTTTTTTKGTGNTAGNKNVATPSCVVSLRSSKVSVATHARAMISLASHGDGDCDGRLTVQVSVKKGKHTQLKTIASGTYVATAGRNLSVALKLNSTGQGLLRAGHGHLKAKLLVTRSFPTALKASTTNVTLSLAKKKG